MENKVKEILCSDNNEEKRMKQPWSQPSRTLGHDKKT
jgi:hypothetical protein